MLPHQEAAGAPEVGQDHVTVASKRMGRMGASEARESQDPGGSGSKPGSPQWWERN